MAKRRAPKRHCAICSKDLFGFDDDMELRALGVSPDHELAAFPGQFMCGPCFESWPLREQYGRRRVEHIQERPETTTRAPVHSDENCLIQVEVKAETASWKPVKLVPQGQHLAILWLATSGTDIVIPLEEWGKERPIQREEKRLRNCEESALDQIWNGLVQRFPSGADLWAAVDVEDVLERHARWLERDRGKS
jgi:hypothetical protein